MPCAPSTGTSLLVFSVLFALNAVTSAGSGSSKSFYARTDNTKTDSPGSPSSCKYPLLEKEEVKDSAFSATSYYQEDYMASAARLTRSKGDFGEMDDMTAWCPKEMVGDELNEYIEITLPHLKVITVIETRGRFAANMGKEYTPFFQIRYQRVENDYWYIYKDIEKKDIMKGNDDSLTPRFLMLKPFIIAKRIRIYPYIERTKSQVCLKLELYGCKFGDGVVSYQIPQGDKASDGTSYEDSTYDGVLTGVGGHLLNNGMGQLMDNIYFRFNVQGDPYQTHKSGYHFVGWKRSKRPRDKPVSLVFEFNSVRKFAGCRIHAANRYGKGIRIFREADFHFSVGGRIFYPENRVVMKYQRDENLQTSRWVQINLKEKIGKWIKMDLYFDDEWMLISEIEFFSEEIRRPVPTETPPTGNPSGARIQTPPLPFLPKEPEKGVIDTGLPRPVPPHEEQSMETSFKHILIIIAALVAILIIAVLIAFVMCRRRRQKKKKKDEPMYSLNRNGSQFRTDGPRSLVVVSGLNARPPALGTTMNGKGFNDSSIYTSLPSEDEEEASAGAGAAGSDVTYATAGPPPHPPIAGVVALSGPCAGAEYASTNIFAPPPPYSSSMYSGSVGVPPRIQIFTNPLPDCPYNLALSASPYKVKPPTAPPPPVSHYPAEMSIQGVSGNTVYAAPKELDAGSVNSVVSIDELGLTQVDRSEMNFVDHLGGGQFGEVHLAEWTPKGDDRNETGIPPTRVAVKMLRTDASDQARRDFETEIRILSRLNDPNIVRVLGISNQGGNLLVLVEYMEFGDLHQYLRERYPCEEIARLPGANAGNKMLSIGALIYIAVQVSSAMKYLESLSMVHRDLACRNCLVGQRLTIKISDFGMSRRLYASDYYRIEGKAILPIRWMAWESLLHGVFTPKSDVWSFGVTLWEILTYCQQQPYADLTDEEVIHNCGNMHAENGEAKYLPHPPNCPKEMYDLMHACWDKNEARRPAFREIHMFLLKNNLGFKPEDYCSSLA